MYYFARFNSDGEIEMVYTTFDPEDPNAEGLTPISREQFFSTITDIQAEPTPEVQPQSATSLESQLAEVITKAKNTI